MENIRDQFPILAEKKDGKRLVYLDNGATTQKPQHVIDAIVRYYTEQNANVHRGLYKLAHESTQLYTEAHRKVEKFIGADEGEVFFTSGTTAGLNFLAKAITDQLLDEGDVIVLTEMDHHSNIVPWQLVTEDRRFKIEWIPVNEADHKLDFEYLDFLVRKYRERLKVISFPLVSNVLGYSQDVKKIVEVAKASGAITIADAAQAVGHKKVDVKELGVDFLVFSGHKMYGPTGIGAVYGRKELLEKIEPIFGGGEMVTKVNKISSEWEELPWKFEAGTPNIEGGIVLGEAVDWIEKNLVWDEVQVHERSLARKLIVGLANFPGLRVFGSSDTKDRASIVSFTHASVHPHDIASGLDEFDVAVRAGFHCAEPLHTKFQTGPTVRVSFAPYNDLDDVEYFLSSLDQVVKKFV